MGAPLARCAMASSSLNNSLSGARKQCALPRAVGSLWFQLQTRFSGCFGGVQDKDGPNAFGGIVNKSTKHQAFDDQVSAVVMEYADRMDRLPTAADKAAILRRFAELHPELLPEGGLKARSKVLHSIHKQTGYVLFKSEAHKRKLRVKKPRVRRPRPRMTVSTTLKRRRRDDSASGSCSERSGLCRDDETDEL